jgi:hypothetical protein
MSPTASVTQSRLAWNLVEARAMMLAAHEGEQLIDMEDCLGHS